MRGFLADDKQALQGCNCFISIYNTIFLIKSKEFLARLKSQIKLFKSTKILKVSSSLTPKLEIRLRQGNKVELTLGQ
ncbi:hypothetical protein Q7W32_09640, partial [Streptococcus suis]|nr:hypothetical protein [Streptococcus suis]